MSIQNDLIRRARSRPIELTINLSQVGSLAEACRSSSYLLPASFADRNGSLEAMIVSGELRFMGIPVRVLGAKAA